MLQEFPKLLGRNFVIAYVLPSAFMFACILAMIDYLALLSQSSILLELATIENTILFSFVSWFFGTLLAALNRLIVRWFEGYSAINPLRLLRFIQVLRFNRLNHRNDLIRIERAKLSKNIQLTQLNIEKLVQVITYQQLSSNPISDSDNQLWKRLLPKLEDWLIDQISQIWREYKMNLFTKETIEAKINANVANVQELEEELLKITTDLENSKHALELGDFDEIHFPSAKIIFYMFLFRRIQIAKGGHYRELTILRRELRSLYHQHSQQIAQQRKNQENLAKQFPYHKDDLLPTAFGNAFRAAESYSLKLYGVESITNWNRIVAVIPEHYQNHLESARTRIDFWVNVRVATLGVLLFCLGLYLFDRDYIFNSYPSWQIVVFPATMFGIHWFAAGRAVQAVIQWGAYYKSAFDLYISNLLKQLGYDSEKLGDRAEDFWLNYSQAITYHLPESIEAAKRIYQNAMKDSQNMDPPTSSK